MKSRALGTVSIALLFLAAVVALRTLVMGGETIQWKNIGPGGGGNKVAVGVSPADANIALMGSDVGGIYRTTDGGLSWSLRNNALVSPSRFSDYGIYVRFQFDPSNPNTVYYGALKSVDAGNTWQIKVDESALRSLGSAIDPTQPSTVYAFGYGNVYRSTDAFESTSCLGIAQPPVVGSCTPGNLCCGTPVVTCAPGSKCYQQSCLPGTGSGQTSADACVNYADSIYAVVVRPSNPNDLLACAESGLYRSTNGARNWSQITPGIEPTSPEPLPSGICHGSTSPPNTPCSVNDDCESGETCLSVQCENLIYHADSDTLFMVVRTHPIVSGSAANDWRDVDSWRGGVYMSQNWGDTWSSVNGIQDYSEYMPYGSFDLPGSPVYGWVATATNPGAVVKDSVDYYGGGISGSSVRFDYTSDSGTESAQLITADFIPVTPGQMYELSAAHKTTNSNGLYVYAKFWWYKSDHTAMVWPGTGNWSSTEGWSKFVTPPSTTSFSWRRYKQRVRVPDRAAYVKISFSAGYGSASEPVAGTTWIDEVSLRKTPDLPRIAGWGSDPHFLNYTDIAVDPTDPTVIYAGTDRATVADQIFGADTSGVWKTTDGGLHWNHVTRRQWHDNVQDNGAAVCGDNVCGGGWENGTTCPNDCQGAGKLYNPPLVNCGDGTCQSGETYDNCLTDCSSDVPPSTFSHEVDYFADPNNYYMTADKFFYAQAGGNPSYYVWTIGIGSGLSGHNTLYIGAPEHLKSTDGGATWLDVTSTRYTGVDSQPGTLAARGATDDVYTGPVATVYDPNTLNTRVYYGDSDNFLQVSYNNGKSFAFEGWQWQPAVGAFGPNTSSAGVGSGGVSSIVLDPSNLNRLYVGAHFQFGNLDGSFYGSVPNTGGVVQGEYTPATGRWQWTPLGNNDPNTPNHFPLGKGGIDLFRTSSGDFLASVFGQGIFRKSGNDWLPVSNYGTYTPQGLLTYRLYQDPLSSSLFFGAGDMSRTSAPPSAATGIWESTDSGATWCRISNHLDVPLAEDNMDMEPVVDLLPTGPNNLLAATYYSKNSTPGFLAGIYKGTRTGSCTAGNSGWTWDRVLAQYEVTGLARSPLDTSLIYAYVGQACCSGAFPGQAAGIYKSVDGGMSWFLMPNNGLGNLGHGRLTFSSTNQFKLYASTVGSGMFEGTITCADPTRDFECATRVSSSGQTVISGTLQSGTEANLQATTPDDTYVVVQESGSHRLRVIWTFPGALAGISYSAVFEGHRTNTIADTITLNYATRSSGSCTGSESYSGGITVNKFADDDLTKTADLGVLPGGQTVFCMQIIDSATNDSQTDTLTVDRLYLLPNPLDVIQRPDTDAVPNQGSPSPSGAHFANVDDDPDDGDATVLSFSAAGQREEFTTVGPLADYDIVRNVRVRWVAKKGSGNGWKGKAGLRTHGVEYFGPDVTLTTNYSMREEVWTNNPWSGQPWTVAEVKAAELIYHQVATATQIPKAKLTEIVLVVGRAP